MKPFVIVFCLILLHTVVDAQFSKQIVVLTDKNNSPYTLNNPTAYLSPKAIERRNRQGLTIDSTDFPVNPAYLESIRSIGNVNILNTSRWLNQVLIETTDPIALQKIQALAFVKKVQAAAPRIGSSRITDKDNLKRDSRPVRKTNKIQGDGNYFNYGSNFDQVNIHEGMFLHNKGFRGEGMTIAVLDAGFYHYTTNPAFDSIRLNNQVLGTWDFVANKQSVTEEHDHGMFCLSTMAANIPGKIVGTAPKAKYYLFRTEDVYSEYQVEEQNWVAAAELADSLGVDLISSSLGYSNFNESAQDYSYSDMDGKTAIITRGAAMAFKKGILITNSAGNSGADAWHYIIAPADAEQVLAIGAVSSSGQVAYFSSYGPSYDGRIKPDIASVGFNTVIADYSGNPVMASGTSLANPNIAGLITCLWQAFPDFSNQEITDAVKKSSSQYHTPDDRIGYGIPNMRIAYQLLEAKRNAEKVNRILGNDWLKLYPVPFTDGFTLLVKVPQTATATIEIFNERGSIVLVKRNIAVQTDIPQYISFTGMNELPGGVYWLRYDDGKNKRIIRILKQ